MSYGCQGGKSTKSPVHNSDGLYKTLVTPKERKGPVRWRGAGPPEHVDPIRKQR
jgi:hypothetical protein